MKILLINDNPVVNKLVTLSAQKTSDDLESVENIDDISLDSYDLLVIDDTLYSKEVMDDLKSKVNFDKSLYICSKDADSLEEFTKVLRKPFLPTDLVEMFSSLGREADEVNLDMQEEEPKSEELSIQNEELETFEEVNLDSNSDDEIEDLDLDSLEADSDDGQDLEDFNLELDSELEELGVEGETEELSDEDLDGFSLEDDSELEDIELDDMDLNDLSEVSEIDDLDLDSDLDTSIEDDLDLESLDLGEELAPVLEITEENEIEELAPVLDEEEVQEVQGLLDEVSELDELSLESDVELEEVNLDSAVADLDLDDELELEEVSEELSIEPETDTEVEDIEELSLESDLELDDTELELEEVNLDSAVADLDLDDELELEEVSEEPSIEPETDREVEDIEELSLESDLDELLSDEAQNTDEVAEELSIESKADTEVEDLENLIESAEEELTQEDLDSEVSLDELDDLTTNEIKIALGEVTEVNSEELADDLASDEVQSSEVSELEELSLESDLESEEIVSEPEELTVPTKTEITPDNNGIEKLKKLLEALTNEDVAASMKGMKININFELGDK